MRYAASDLIRFPGSYYLNLPERTIVSRADYCSSRLIIRRYLSRQGIAKNVTARSIKIARSYFLIKDDFQVTNVVLTRSNLPRRPAATKQSNHPAVLPKEMTNLDNLLHRRPASVAARVCPP